jgi:hypothetical protein
LDRLRAFSAREMPRALSSLGMHAGSTLGRPTVAFIIGTGATASSSRRRLSHGEESKERVV